MVFPSVYSEIASIIGAFAAVAAVIIVIRFRVIDSKISLKGEISLTGEIGADDELVIINCSNRPVQVQKVQIFWGSKFLFRINLEKDAQFEFSPTTFSMNPGCVYKIDIDEQDKFGWRRSQLRSARLFMLVKLVGRRQSIRVGFSNL